MLNTSFPKLVKVMEFSAKINTQVNGTLPYAKKKAHFLLKNGLFSHNLELWSGEDMGMGLAAGGEWGREDADHGECRV